MKKRYVEFRVDDVESMLEARSVIEDCLMALYQMKIYGTTDAKKINEISQREFLDDCNYVIKERKDNATRT